jgi:hypothetical protein
VAKACASLQHVANGNCRRDLAVDHYARCAFNQNRLGIKPPRKSRTWAREGEDCNHLPRFDGKHRSSLLSIEVHALMYVVSTLNTKCTRMRRQRQASDAIGHVLEGVTDRGCHQL